MSRTSVPSASLPSAASPAAFEQLGRDDPRIESGARHLAERHRAGPVTLVPSGSVPVFHAGARHVLKLFPPCYAHEAAHEEAVLVGLGDALPVPIPRVEASGELDGWRYLLLSRIAGTPLVEVWAELSAVDRRALAAETGELLAALHRAHAPGSADAAAWARFLHEQRASAAERQRLRGADPRWVEQIPEFLAAVRLPDEIAPVLLHTEIMREHLFAAPAPTGWRLTGVIDFEPAMRGCAEYEFASVGVYLTGGDAGALQALLLAYGYAARDLGPELQRRFLAYALLHRYASLPRYLRRAPAPAARTLDDLARCWWALDDARESR